MRYLAPFNLQSTHKMPICTKCRQNKAMDAFQKRTGTPKGHCSQCRQCHREGCHLRQHGTLDTFKYVAKQRGRDMRGRGAEYQPVDGKKVCSRCHDTKDVSEYHRVGYGKKYLAGYCKECHSRQTTANRDPIKTAAWRRKAENRVASALRKRIHQTILRQCAAKDDGTAQLVGCSWTQLKVHLQSQLREGMTWETYGASWVIDHIKPLSSFDLGDKEQQLAATHYTNLQPLTRKENAEKSDRLPDGTRGRDLLKVLLAQKHDCHAAQETGESSA